ncbi:hypothetical protein MVEN_00294800 [Mycena venus]|uniref:Vacuolar protein 8 n=1 Tax=Mycena venus TaxID=2733690 RepID=A0A8H6YZZ4_9AGAR|nr:hypothetical protein MVEN_00294800 [Mycena venus]
MTLAWIAGSAEGAQAVVNARTLNVLDKVMKLPDQTTACWLLHKLGSHESTRSFVLNTNPYQYIVALLSNESSAWNALLALRSIAKSLESANALVDAGVLCFLDKLAESSDELIREEAFGLIRDLTLYTSAPSARAVVAGGALQVLDKLLGSSDSEVREEACNLLNELALDTATSAAVLSVNPCQRLVSLLPDDPAAAAALDALDSIARSTEGAEAVVESRTLEFVDQLLQSPTSRVRSLVSMLLSTLAGHESTAAAVFNARSFEQLASLLQDEDSDVITEAEVPTVIDQLLDSSENWVRKCTCNLLCNLARSEATATAARGDNRCQKLVHLSREDVPAVAYYAAYALAKLAYWSDGAAAVVAAGALQLLDDLAKSSIAGVRRCVAVLLSHLARHQLLTATVLAANPCQKLIALLQDDDSDVVEPACKALSWISKSPEGAQAVLDAGTNRMIDQLLDSSNTDVRMWMCSLVGYLAQISSLPAIWNGNRIQKLMELLHDNAPAVAHDAVFALSQIAGSVGGATAVVEAGILQICDQLLESGIVGVRRLACVLLQNVASHESTAGILLKKNPCRRLVALLRDPETIVVECALHALASIASQADGALAVAETDAPNMIDEVLEASENGVRGCACYLLYNLARFEATAAVARSDNRCQKLVDLSREDVPAVACNAAYALAMFAYWNDGAAAVVTAGGLQLLDDLSGSSIVGVHRWVAVLLAHLARHPLLTANVLAANPCQKLIALLQDSDSDAIEPAINALSWISESPEGAQAVLDAGINDIFDQLLESSNTDVLMWICSLIGNLARLPPMVPALWEGNRCKILMELSRNDMASIGRNAVVRALALIAYWTKGAAAIVDAETLQQLDDFVQSPIAGVRGWTCVILQNLALHEPTLTYLLSTNSCARLVQLLRDPDIDVIESAMRALVFIASHSDGAVAMCGAGATHIIDLLLESSESDIRNWTCNLLGNLARFGATATAAWEDNRCQKLVKLSHDDASSVAINAVYALAQTACWSDGAAAIIDAGVLKRVDELMQSTIPGVRGWTCSMLEHLARHQSTLTALLDSNPCERLCILLHDENALVTEAAAYALAAISYSEDGTQAVLEAETLDVLVPLLGRPTTDIHRWVCATLGNIAQREPAVETLLASNACTRLVSLLRNPTLYIHGNALQTLSVLCRWPKAATAIAKTSILDHVSELMESEDRRVRWNTCLILAHLPRRKPLTPSPGAIAPAGLAFILMRTSISYIFLLCGIVVSFTWLLEFLGSVWN